MTEVQAFFQKFRCPATFAYTHCTFRKSSPTKQVKYTHRAYTDEGGEAFQQDLNTQSWAEVYGAPGTDSKTEVFQGIGDF